MVEIRIATGAYFSGLSTPVENSGVILLDEPDDADPGKPETRGRRETRIHHMKTRDFLQFGLGAGMMLMIAQIGRAQSSTVTVTTPAEIQTTETITPADDVTAPRSDGGVGNSAEGSFSTNTGTSSENGAVSDSGMGNSGAGSYTVSPNPSGPSTSTTVTETVPDTDEPD